MKWKLIYVLIINALKISVTCCWPFGPPPQPPPMPPLHLFEDHYVRVSHGPHFDRGLTHMASSPMSSGPHHEPLNHHLFLPINPMAFAEPEDRAVYDESASFDLGTTREFSQYLPNTRNTNPKPMMKVRHMNYRYRKRMKTQRPIGDSINNSATNKKESGKYYDNNGVGNGVGQQPRRYNVIDNRHRNAIPNSVNDKLSHNHNNKVISGEDTSHNVKNKDLSPNSSNNNNKTQITINDDNITSEKTVKDLYENNSQTKDRQNGIRHSVDSIPIEITSYDMKSANGAVTQVTEMLYDIENNPFTPTPVMSPFLPPSSTPALMPVTSDPRPHTQAPYRMNTDLSHSSDTFRGSQPIPPMNTAITGRFNGITMTPIMPWESTRNSIDPAVPMVWTEPTLSPPPPPTLRTSIPSSQSSEYNPRRTRKRLSTHRPLTTSKSSARESQRGLSGAAIAGIVIGSMVSIVLLAGTSLFVMYRNPFRRSIGGPLTNNVSSLSPPAPVPPPIPVQPNASNTIPSGVHRWHPRRQRRS